MKTMKKPTILAAAITLLAGLGIQQAMAGTNRVTFRMPVQIQGGEYAGRPVKLKCFILKGSSTISNYVVDRYRPPRSGSSLISVVTPKPGFSFTKGLNWRCQLEMMKPNRRSWDITRVYRGQL